MKSLLAILVFSASFSSFAGDINRSYKKNDIKMRKLALIAMPLEHADCVNDYFAPATGGRSSNIGFGPFAVQGPSRDDKVVNKSVKGYISAILDTSRYEPENGNFAFYLGRQILDTSGSLTAAINQNRQALEQSALLKEIRTVENRHVNLDEVLAVIRRGNKSRELCKSKLLDLNELSDYVTERL